MILTKKIKKILAIVIGSILVFALIVILFISPITKYLIEKYDESYLHRKVTIGWAYVNPFTGYVHLSNLKIYEAKSDSVFLSAQSISVNISMHKLISRTYEITEFTLDHPRAVILQNKNDFNFTDLVKNFSPEIPDTSESAHFSILNIKIIDGEIYYREPLIPVNYFVKEINIDCKGKRWDLDTVAVKFSLLSGNDSGSIKGNVTLNFKTQEYNYVVAVQKFDLNLIAQYLKDLTNYGHFTANLDADIQSKGKFNDPEDVSITGTMQINNFHFGKNTNEDYASFDKLLMVMNEVSPKNHRYLFDSVLLSHPYFKYEIYDSLDNFQTIFGKNGSKVTPARAVGAEFNLIIEIARYIKILAKNFFHSYYQVKHLAVQNGDIKFNDYSMSEKFSVDLSPMSITADSIDKNHKKVDIYFKSGIKPFGDAVINLSVNPQDSGTFDMQYRVQKIPASMFNPYTIAFTSYPLDRGTAEIHGTWNVNNGKIQSENHLVIIDMRVTQRRKSQNLKWLPLPLIVSFIRDRGNVVDYEIPITGNLKNPKFHLHDVFTDVLENIFVKPATTSYRLEVKNTETEIEKSLAMKWEIGNSLLKSTQIKFIEKIADFLVKNPDASITIQPEQYSLKEKEALLLYEVKKKYFISSNHGEDQTFNKEDSEVVSNLSIKDPLFNHYLNKQTNDSMLFTIQEKCSRIIGTELINEKFRQLNEEREIAFNYYFKEKNVEQRVIFLAANSTIPYDGFTFYKINYAGKYPESLIKAYKQMMKLNDEAPRDKFKNEREKNKNALSDKPSVKTE